MPNTSPEDFNHLIKGSFAEIIKSAGDFELNKSAISAQMLDILKAFHIFWNILRQKNLLSQTQPHTLSIIQNILEQIKEQDNSMKAITFNLIENIKEAYFRFIRAHRFHRTFQQFPKETIQLHMLKRYKEVVSKIRDNKANSLIITSEVNLFLDMLRAFHIINYNNGSTDQECYRLYQTMIQ